VTSASKNCKVRAVLFDFEAITSSFGYDSDTGMLSGVQVVSEKAELSSVGRVTPNLDEVEHIADLLNVKLGLDDSKKGRNFTDNLKFQKSHVASDIRTKYADRLTQSRHRASLAALDRVKEERTDFLSRGDAATHFAARKITTQHSTRWIAGTGVGTLLTYLSQRSIDICLLPSHGAVTNELKISEYERMLDIEKQLTDVTFTLLLRPDETTWDTESCLSSCAYVMNNLESIQDAKSALLVSRREEYIKAAKQIGMATCRISPPNSRRGNLSAHYTVQSFREVRQVVDNINGISFNAVLNGQ